MIFFQSKKLNFNLLVLYLIVFVDRCESDSHSHKVCYNYVKGLRTYKMLHGIMGNSARDRYNK